MKLSNKTRLLLSIGYILFYFLISYLFTIGVFSIAYKRVFFYIYLGIGVLFNVVYYANNKEEFMKYKWRNLIMLLVIIASYFLIKSDFYKDFLLSL